MPSLAEIRRALHGAWRFIFIDPRALLEYDGSAKGALHSFWAAAIVLPLNALAVTIPTLQRGTAAGPISSISIETIGYMVAWPILLAVIYGLVRWYGRGDRYWLFVCTYNWTQIPIAIVTVIITLLDAVITVLVGHDTAASLPTGPAILIGLAFLFAQVLQVAALAYEWYVAWVSLEAGFLIPIIVVLLDYALGMSVHDIALRFA